MIQIPLLIDDLRNCALLALPWRISRFLSFVTLPTIDCCSFSVLIRNRVDALLRVICTRFLSNSSRRSAAVPGCRYVVRASLLLSGHDARQPSRFSACARSRVERRTRQGWNEMRWRAKDERITSSKWTPRPSPLHTDRVPCVWSLLIIKRKTYNLKEKIAYLTTLYKEEGRASVRAYSESQKRVREFYKGASYDVGLPTHLPTFLFFSINSCFYIPRQTTLFFANV